MSLESARHDAQRKSESHDGPGSKAPLPGGRQAKWRAGVLGATGLVGQRIVKLLADHPWFH